MWCTYRGFAVEVGGIIWMMLSFHKYSNWLIPEIKLGLVSGHSNIFLYASLVGMYLNSQCGGGDI